MWMLSFIPDSWIVWAIHAITMAGAALFIAGTIVKQISWISKYGVIMRILGFLLFGAGLYFEGGRSCEVEWRNKLEVAQAEAELIKQKSKEINTKVVTKYIERVKVVKENTNAISAKVNETITEQDNANCTIPNTAILLHDHASKNIVPDTTRGTNAGASDVTLSRLLDTTVLNYGTFYEVREQLKALQDWVRDQKKINP